MPASRDRYTVLPSRNRVPGTPRSVKPPLTSIRPTLQLVNINVFYADIGFGALFSFRDGIVQQFYMFHRRFSGSHSVAEVST